MESEDRNSRSTHLPKIHKSPHPRLSVADCELIEFIKYRQKNKDKLQNLGLAAFKRSKRHKFNKEVVIRMPKIAEPKTSSMKLNISYVSESKQNTKRINQSVVRKKTVTQQTELDHTLQNFQSSIKKNKEYIKYYKDQRKRSLEEVVLQTEPEQPKSYSKEIIVKERSLGKGAERNKLGLFQSIDSMLKIRYKTEGIPAKKKKYSKRYIDVEELNLMAESKVKSPTDNPEQMRKSWRRVSVNDKMEINYGSSSFLEELNRIAEYKLKTEHCFEQYVSNFSVLVAIDISRRLRKQE